MDIMQRSEAMRFKIGQYYTGKPCRHGHIAPRYTQSGACTECVSIAARRGQALKRNSPRAERMANLEQRRTAIRDLVEIKVPAHEQDLSMLVSLAATLCTTRHSVLTPDDVASGQRVPGVPGLYRLRVPEGDVQLVRDTADALYGRTPPDTSRVERYRQGLISRLEQEGEQPHSAL